MEPSEIPQEARDRLQGFQIDPERGFLSSSDPLQELPNPFGRWEETAQDMPKLLAAGKLRTYLDQLPILDISTLQSDTEYERAMLILSYFGHGYVWGGTKVRDRIPPGVAVPWYQVSEKLGRPPILSYASYALHNWRRIETSGPIAIGNVSLLQNFLAGVDEEWFILVHVDIEAKAAPVLTAVVQAQVAVRKDQAKALAAQLSSMARALEGIYETLSRMPENCDPYIYYHRVRPYIHGWKDHPSLLNGVIYEGVDAYDGQPQRFRGETGAQSSIVPTLDAALGVTHRADPLRPYLVEMRNYMPPAHRDFIKAVEDGPPVRNYVIKNRQDGALRDAYNQCLSLLERFRSQHLEYAANYIQKQSLTSPYNPTERGTGGTPFLPYLKKHRDETAEHVIT
jgi:indoleamine 2,3-dioxygenase